ncbi:MAG: hypothetical protein JO241_00235 [Candidatus Eremiobacteraeota bacterium]|nr:hypothetical protein [Candidatus Eremiobacteraeota bacterium]MBV8582393.1 hypothetical protein [Candidatus Eremiobacteraeota bacterium]
MADVRISRNLKVPPGPAVLALAQVLEGIAAQDGPWRGFALHVRLGDVHLPDVGYLAVPIRLTAGARDAQTNALPVEFEALEHPSSFPRFSGSIGIDATGPSGAILFVAGDYDVPMQLFGTLIDRTLAAGVADRTLENLADDLAAAVHAAVDKREAEYARYRLY